MIRQWLRNWLGITELEGKVLPRNNLVSREGKRIKPPKVVGDTTVTVTYAEPETPIKKGYDAAI